MPCWPATAEKDVAKLGGPVYRAAWTAQTCSIKMKRLLNQFDGEELARRFVASATDQNVSSARVHFVLLLTA